MEASFITQIAIPITVTILLFGYAGFCWVTQKVHVRGKGWKHKEEYPKTFYFTVFILVAIGIGQIFSAFYFYRKF